MRIDIPFVGQIKDKEQADWCEAISSRSQHFNLTPIDTLRLELLQQVEVAVVANPDPERLKALPKLKWIQSLWAGVEGILDSAISSELFVVRLKDPQMAESMAEAVLAWTLYLHRKMPQYAAQQSLKQWQEQSLSIPQECNVSIFGLGKLGSIAAMRLEQNNFTVRGWSNSKKSIGGIETFHGPGGFESILAATNIAVILLPLTEETKGLFNKSSMAKLPTNASIINFARGPIVVEADLLEYLNSKRLDHAVLDVFNQEPLPPSNPLWIHPNVTVLPHISAPTTLSTAAAIAAENIDNFLSTGDIPEAVDRTKGY